VDEGTDTASVDDPLGVGLSVIDNIDINGTLITKGTNRQDKGNDDPGDQKDNDGKNKGKDN
jgi:hypothetical protein